MSESTFPLKKVILIIAVTWILSLVTTLAVVYVEPSFFPTLFQSASQNQIEIVRFYEPDEMNVTGYQYWVDTVASFVWTPKDPTNNAILAVYYYFEYSSDEPKEYVWEWENPTFWWELTSNVYVNEFYSTSGKISRSASTQVEWEEKYPIEWEQTSFIAQPIEALWINPNQNNYTLKLGVYHSDRASASTPTFVRNINVIIEVVDGLPSAT